MGLETAKRALSTAQSALYTTGHNVANANTEGYSRQRVNLKPTPGFPSPGMNMPRIPGQLGTGVEAGSIQRVRDAFIDSQYRNENKSLGYWSTKVDNISQMEDILNEPTDEGLAKVINEFWSAFEDLSVNPEDSGARAVVRQRGNAVAETFNYITGRLSAIKKEIGTQIDNSELEINSLLSQINDINQQIGSVEPHGLLPNDLYDRRDNLVDQLSKFMNIQVSTTSSGGNALPIAEGKYTIDVLDDSGKKMGTLLNGRFDIVNKIEVTHAADANPSIDPDYVTDIKIGTETVDIRDFSSQGSLLGLIESYGYTDPNSADPANPDVKGLYPDMLASLDIMAYNFASKVNEVHQSGWSITEINTGIKDDKTFFDLNGLTATNYKGAAGMIALHSDISSSLDNIAAASSVYGVSIDGTLSGANVNAKKIEVTRDALGGITVNFKDAKGNLLAAPAQGTFTGPTVISDVQAATGLNLNVPTSAGTWNITVPSDKKFVNGFVGDGSNALKLANVKDDTSLLFGSETTSIQSYYQSVIGDLGVQGSEAIRMDTNSQTLLDSIKYNRDSVSSVSLDEEMSDMVKFQHAYNAAARAMTAVDEMLDKIINGMGLVGR